MKERQIFESQLIALMPNMRNFAYSLTLNRDAAEDLTQDTSLKALDNRDKYTDNVNFKGWLLTIMKNIFINNYRRLVRINTIADATDEQHFLNSAQNRSYETPESRYEVIEINKKINNFSDEYSVPFKMHVQGYKYEEIAKQMRLPLGTVKSRIFLTRKRLQEQLKDYQYA
ncbi:MAG: RNA polymerase sigma factor [Prevotellaceae bacterium]|jgi:RNA polymerase sigma-70 factor (ECF subfamily)|nr:RNA polymerase sigma factor [Prevotellaceae bacterium]